MSFNENSVLSGFDGKFLSKLKVSWLPSLPLDGNLSEGQHRLSGRRSTCAAHSESAQRTFELLWAILCHPLPSVRLFTTCKSGRDAPTWQEFIFSGTHPSPFLFLFPLLKDLLAGYGGTRL